MWHMGTIALSLPDANGSRRRAAHVFAAEAIYKMRLSESVPDSEREVDEWKTNEDGRYVDDDAASGRL
jgi:hypothetical protein